MCTCPNINSYIRILTAENPERVTIAHVFRVFWVKNYEPSDEQSAKPEKLPSYTEGWVEMLKFSGEIFNNSYWIHVPWFGEMIGRVPTSVSGWAVREGEEKVSPPTMTWTYDGQTSTDFWPKTKSHRRLAVVGQKGRLESGRRIGESTYYDVYLRRPDVGRFFNQDKKLPTSGRGRWEWEKKCPLTMTCTYDCQTSADFWPKTKSCRHLSMVSECEGESTYYEMYLRRPDIGRFLTWDKKLPTSGRGRSEGEIREWRRNVIPLTMTCTYDGQTSADFWPEKKSCRRLAVVGESGRRKGESTYNDMYLGWSDISRFLTQDKTHSNLEDWQLLGLKININVGSILREKLWDVWESVLFEKNDMMN